MTQDHEAATTEASGAGEAVATPSDAPLPLSELDALLAPMRRVLAYAIRGEGRLADSVRYLGVNGSRWLAPALGLDLPHAIRDVLAFIAARLAGFDDASLEERHERVQAMYQQLCRIDALLGLPLEGVVGAAPPARPGDAGRRRKRATAAPAEAVAEPPRDPEDGVESGARGRVDRRRGRGRREGRRADRRGEREVAKQLTADESEAPRAPRGVFRPYDPVHSGRSLRDVAGDEGLRERLAAADIETVADVLFLAPVDEEVLRPIHGAGRELPLGRVAVGGRVKHRIARLGPGRAHTEILVLGAGPLVVRWPKLAPPWLVERLMPDERVVVVGERVEGSEVLEDAEVAADDGTHAVRLQHYGVEGVGERELRALVERLLPEAEQLRDPLPGELLRRTGLPEIGEAIADVHRKGGARPEGRARFAFEEALLAFLGLGLGRAGAARDRGITHGIMHGLASRMARVAEFELSDGQQLALEEIKRDLRGSSPMFRVLTGPTGGGRGLVALVAATVVAENKAQVLWVSPDEVSAENRFLFAEPLLREVGLVARLAGGDPGRGQVDALRRGEVHVLFGTSELLTSAVEFRRLGLVVSEEHDHFGSTAAALTQVRSPRPDVLVLTAAPVPAEVLVSAYGATDLSVIPAAADAQPVLRIVFTAEQRKEAYARAAAAIAAGRQVYVVFPMVRGADALDGREALRVKTALESEVFQGARVALFHGAMGREDRWRVYDDFRHHRLDVLVATTRFEDGPPVPAGSVAIVEQADRISPLRLRRVCGHLARAALLGPHECLLIAGDVPDAAGLAVVHAFADSDDDCAFVESLVPPDGVEALIHADAPRVPSFRWLQPATDRALLQDARREARRVLADDPGLRRGNHGDLAALVRERWDDLFTEPCPLADDSSSKTASLRRRRRRRKRR